MAVICLYEKEKRVRHLIVVNQDDWVVCSFRSRLSTRNENHCRSSVKHASDFRKFSEQDLVQDYMSWTTETVDIDMPIEAVASLFLEKNFQRACDQRL